jgi:hypothetical protein
MIWLMMGSHHIDLIPGASFPNKATHRMPSTKNGELREPRMMGHKRKRICRLWATFMWCISVLGENILVMLCGVCIGY